MLSHKVYFKSVGSGIVHFIHFTNTGCYEVVAFLSRLQKFAIVEGYTQFLSVRSVWRYNCVNLSSPQFKSFAKQLVLHLLIKAKLFQILLSVEASLPGTTIVNWKTPEMRC